VSHSALSDNATFAFADASILASKITRPFDEHLRLTHLVHQQQVLTLKKQAEGGPFGSPERFLKPEW
jgi:hypothetical protein